MAIAPDEAVFIDDNADNIAGARAYGMEAVHFGVDPWAALAELDAILDRRGISTSLSRTVRARRDQSSSRWTVSGEKAGRHTAMYSAPSGVEYCTHSPACAMTA